MSSSRRFAWPSRRSRPRPFLNLPPLVGADWPLAPGDRLIAVLVYDGVTSAEVEVTADRLCAGTGARAVLVATHRGRHQGIEPVRDVMAAAAIAEVHRADIVVVPGGVGWRAQAEQAEVRTWLQALAPEARGVLALSTGPLVLASAGLLAGVEAACHWLAADDLARLGARPAAGRVAASLDERLVTAAGAVSAEAACARLIDRLQWGR